jgi:hypothetical protein
LPLESTLDPCRNRYSIERPSYAIPLGVTGS